MSSSTPRSPCRRFPAARPGVLAAFGLFSRVEGTFFRFRTPPEILSVQAWDERPAFEHLPIDDPIGIGYEIWRSQDMGAGQILEGESITMDSAQGDVYYADADTWMRLDEAPDDEFELHELAADVPAFFNECVFGPRYPELVTLVLGGSAIEHRVRKGPDKGEPADSWLRLLRTAGILPH